MAMLTTQAAGKIAELHVFSELMKRGVVPYLPLVDEGVDALVRTPTGQVIELQIKSAASAGGRDPRWFQVAAIEPRINFFILGVEAKNGEPGDVWIFPAAVFDKYAGRPAKGTPRDLNLDIGTKKYGMPLREVLCGFRNRWELIVDYERYQAQLDSPEDLEDLLAMKEALETPEEESVTLEDYAPRRPAALSS